MSDTPYELTVLDAIDASKGMQKEDWGQLASPDFPFNDYGFLTALAGSGSLGEDKGWVPKYLVLRKDGRLEGASCLYVKTNSYGEYIFDWDWARAYEQYNIPYYPKLIASSPFTPATGPKLMVRSGAEQSGVAERLIKAAADLCVKEQYSSLHYLFLAQNEVQLFADAGFLIRHSFQYHWHNREYDSFDSFLAALIPKKRKQILRERSQLSSSGIEVKIYTGKDLLSEHADMFYRFYLSTIKKMQAIPYLNVEFFRQVFSLMRESVVLMIAEDKGEPVAGALYFTKGKNLYGRYWGATREVRNLHFELCYYQPIEWAIARGISIFEAGAQGEHKLARGFTPQLTYSAHFIKHEAFRDGIARFISEEKKAIAGYFSDLEQRSPYLK